MKVIQKYITCDVRIHAMPALLNIHASCFHKWINDADGGGCSAHLCPPERVGVTGRLVAAR